MDDNKDVLEHRVPRSLKFYAIGALLLATVAVAFGVTHRRSDDRTLVSETHNAAVPVVKVIKLARFTGDTALVLPGTLEAFNSAPIHARVSGYLKHWYVDIGTHVTSGQLMAEIDVPDLDQQLATARAELATEIANERLAASTATRWSGLLAQDAVSKQEDDEKHGDLTAKQARVAAARANVDRLLALEGFKRITAPFDGVVTTRATDIGALIAVGSSSDTPLFTVADQRRLRIYVNVPQGYSGQIRSGMTASFTVPQHPGKEFEATVVTTAQAIEVQSGTLKVQLQTDNRNFVLHPGDYAQVKFKLEDSSAIAVPVSALMFREKGIVVATVGANDRIQFRPITISRDFGPEVEVASGLSLSDRIVDNPPDLLEPGDQVRPVSGSGRPDGA
jgi:RND family efflux transporter MFP subunit